MYDIVLTQTAIKDLEKLDKDIKIRIISKLKEYSNTPFDHASKLRNPELGTYRFRIGNYRVIFDTDDNKIIILRIGHRKEIYK